jgi:N-acetylmuramoyl-L-alanine amidase
VNRGHEFGYTPFPDVQMDSVIALCSDILKRHSIPPVNVVGHSDIAPTRKIDPGELFDWKLLAKNDIGLFPPSPSPDYVSATALPQFGYDTNHLEATITAFQRRFRPEHLTGKWDDECGKLLAALLSML